MEGARRRQTPFRIAPATMEADHRVPHVAMFPSPGVGHLTPLLEFSRLLVSAHGLRVTIFTITTEAPPPEAHVLARSATTLPDGLRLFKLPPSPPVSVPIDASIEHRVSVLVESSIPSLRSALLAFLPAPDVLVVDIFGTDAFDIADELGMSRYFFSTVSAGGLALAMYLPALDLEVEGEYAELAAPVRVPGCRPIQPHKLPDTVLLKRADSGRQKVLRHFRRAAMTQGILINSCAELEPEPLAAMAQDPAFTKIPLPRLFPIGPVFYDPPDAISFRNPAPAWLQWLDLQPEGSVLLVSFGSGGTLSAEQTTELAWGLERSEQRFLWVIRRPVDGESSAAYLTTGRDLNDPVSYLPEGFMSRTEGRAFLLPSWAPQVAILRHPAVGGFITHCGWNSVLEALSHGVALVAWPLFAEQRMNAENLEELGVAVRVRAAAPKLGGAGGLVTKEEVERVARLLMDPEAAERKALKEKAAELRETVAGALGEGGSSRKTLLELVAQWKRRCPADTGLRRP